MRRRWGAHALAVSILTIADIKDSVQNSDPAACTLRGCGDSPALEPQDLLLQRQQDAVNESRRSPSHDSLIWVPDPPWGFKEAEACGKANDEIHRDSNSDSFIPGFFAVLRRGWSLL
jgi:hypothetical protein